MPERDICVLNSKWRRDMVRLAFVTVYAVDPQLNSLKLTLGCMANLGRREEIVM